MSKQDEVSIKYIGKREPWSDRLYRTGLVFDCDQVRTIPWDMARKFLRHEDLFEKVDVGAKDKGKASQSSKADTPNDSDKAADDTQALLDEQASKNKDKDDEQSELQALYDQVNVMDKDALKDFAFTHYQQKLNKSKSEENLRIEVNGMIDQFGAP